MAYIIHYIAGRAYDGCDIHETEPEYIRARDHRRSEGWQRIGLCSDGDDTTLVMWMPDRIGEARP